MRPWKAIGYLRCSTHEQSHSCLGPEVQAECIRPYATLESMHKDIITDAAVSGGKPLAKRLVVLHRSCGAAILCGTCEYFVSLRNGRRPRRPSYAIALARENGLRGSRPLRSQ